MPTIEAPTLADFQPLDTHRSSFGLDYLRMINPDGIQLDLTDEGATAIDRDPEIAALFGRISKVIAEHAGYRDVTVVKASEPGGIPQVAEKPWDLYHTNKRLASVYRPDAVPGTIVKAYDYDLKSAGFQFYVGDWMQKGLAAASNNVYAPKQYGLFSSRFGLHRTAVMECLPGESLPLRTFVMQKTPEDIPAYAAMTRDVKLAVLDRIRQALGQRGLILANDIRYNPSNIIVPDPETFSLENALEWEFGVIDQPVVRYRNLGLLSLARYLPIDRRAQPVLAPQPVGSEAI